MRGPGLPDVGGLEEGWERWVTKVVAEIRLLRAAKPQADCEELQKGIIIPSDRMIKQPMKCNVD